jgi:hypothetical protein
MHVSTSTTYVRFRHKIILLVFVVVACLVLWCAHKLSPFLFYTCFREHSLETCTEELGRVVYTETYCYPGGDDNARSSAGCVFSEFGRIE